MKRTSLLLWLGLSVPAGLLAAEPIVLDFSRSAAAVGAGGFDARVGLEITPDMVALAEGKLVLRARSEP